MDRRQFLATPLYLALCATAPGVVGCRPRPSELGFLKDHGDSSYPLVVDTHAHIFNASDLQVSKFVSKVAVSEAESSAVRFMAEMFGPVLQFVGWNLSPSARREIRVLNDYASSIASEEGLNAALDQKREEQYQVARTELERATREALEERGERIERFREPLESMSDEDQAIGSLLDMPESYEALFLSSPEEAGLGGHLRKLRAAQRFLVEMFQYRHVSTVRYFSTYREDGFVCDLMTPCMVDYDWWLDNGNPTRSSLPQQVEVNYRIASLSHGRVHPFVPFDPLRQIMWDKYGEGGFSPIEMVRDAILDRGFVGVKLYPPMGFAVYGNAIVQHEEHPVWQGKDLHPVTQEPGFAAKLDAALDQLYEFCSGHGVAVMAHSSPSNLAHRDFAPLADIEHWHELFKAYDVQTNFGHFNGMGSGADAGRWQAFVNALNDEVDTNLRFADASYFRDVLADQGAIVPILRRILFDASGNPSRVMSKLMYGTDWKMLLMEVDSAGYMASMLNVLDQADEQLLEAGFDSDLKNAVMGNNAADFLGLRRGKPARNRLEEFYSKHQIEDPPWMKKVDEQSPSSASA